MTTPGVRKKTPEELAELRRISEAQHFVRMAAHATCERISEGRKAKILQSISDGDLQILADLRDPLEVHFFASNWNGDQGADPLLQIVQHASCDAGTALWLYWDNDPYYYSQFQNLDEAEDDETRTMLSLSRVTEDRFLRNDFASSVIPFNPENWIEDKPIGARAKAHAIPEMMLRPISAK